MGIITDTILGNDKDYSTIGTIDSFIKNDQPKDNKLTIIDNMDTSSGTISISPSGYIEYNKPNEKTTNMAGSDTTGMINVDSEGNVSYNKESEKTDEVGMINVDSEGNVSYNKPIEEEKEPIVQEKKLSINDILKGNEIDTNTLIGQQKLEADTYKSSQKQDRRISLNVCPKDYYGKIDTNSYKNRILDTLGSAITDMNGTDIHGILYDRLHLSGGLIFPYTPTIQMSRKANYDTLDVFHSNFSTNYYKNTPPPTIQMNEVTFTADNRENAFHMLAAILFLTASVQSEFGVQANERKTNGVQANKAGLPPPILYLNGYDNLIDNIPVLLKDISYTYPKDKHYVNLVIDLSQKNEPISSYRDDNNMYINGTSFGYGAMLDSQSNYKLSFWLPTELTFNIQMVVQPNPLKVKHIYDLDKFKSGAMFFDKETFTKEYSQYIDKLVEKDGQTYAVTDSQFELIQSDAVLGQLQDNNIKGTNVKKSIGSRKLKNNTGWFW